MVAYVSIGSQQICAESLLFANSSLHVEGADAVASFVRPERGLPSEAPAGPLQGRRRMLFEKPAQPHKAGPLRTIATVVSGTVGVLGISALLATSAQAENLPYLLGLISPAFLVFNVLFAADDSGQGSGEDQVFTVTHKLFDDFPIGGTFDVSNLQNRVGEDLACFANGQEKLQYLANVAQIINFAFRGGQNPCDKELLGLMSDVFEIEKKIIDASLPSDIGGVDLYNLFIPFIRQIKPVEDALVSSGLADHEGLSRLAGLYHILGKYGYMFYGIKSFAAANEYRVKALVALISARKRFEALSMNDRAAEVSNDIEEIRTRFNIPEEVPENTTDDEAVLALARKLVSKKD